MRNLLLAIWFFSVAASAHVLINPEHAGAYDCVCTDKYCDSQLGKLVQIAIEADPPWLAVDYGEDLHSGTPTRTVDKKTGFVSYYLASGANVGFTTDGRIWFGLGKIWTCTKK